MLVYDSSRITKHLYLHVFYCYVFLLQYRHHLLSIRFQVGLPFEITTHQRVDFVLAYSFKLHKKCVHNHNLVQST